MSVENFSKDLVNHDGIWHSRAKKNISYPNEGNDGCFQIEDNSFWFRHRNNCIAELIKRFSPGNAFFDIGGGNGFVAKGIQGLGIDTFLVEPGEGGCVNGRKRGVKNVICSTLEDAGFEENSLPALGAFDVVEHIESDVAILNSFNRFLKKDGLCFITVPAYRFIWSNDDDYAGHYNRYTLKELNGKLESAGFDILYSSYLFSILPLTIFFFRSIPSRIKGKNYKMEAAKDDHNREIAVLNKIWDWEFNRVKAGKSVPFGSSCLVVAKKR